MSLHKNIPRTVRIAEISSAYWNRLSERIFLTAECSALCVFSFKMFVSTSFRIFSLCVMPQYSDGFSSAILFRNIIRYYVKFTNTTALNKLFNLFHRIDYAHYIRKTTSRYFLT